MSITVKFDGHEYDFDGERLMLSEAVALQQVTGMTVQEWFQGFNRGDALSIAALIWLVRRRNGETGLKFSEVDGDLGTFSLEAPDAEGQGENPSPDSA